MLGNVGFRNFPTAFSPAALFAVSDPGVWYDPSDLSTLYQDSAGTTPVTAPAQPVGLMLDKSQGSATGPEIVVNGTFDTSVSGWTAGGATIAVENQRLKITNTGAAFGYAYQSFTTIVGRTYLISADINVGTVGTVYLRAGISALSFSYFNGSTSTNKVVSGTFVATATTSFVHILNTNVTDGFSTVDNISVKLVTGSQATQSTAGSRPTYGIVPATGRRNLVTFSEDFTNAVWVKANATVVPNSIASPNGSLTASSFIENTAASVAHEASQTLNFTTGVRYTMSFYIKAIGSRSAQLVFGTGAFAESRTWFNLATLTATTTVGSVSAASVIDVGNGWYRCSVSQIANATSSSPVVLRIWNGSTAVYTGDGTSGLYLWGAQVEASSSATAYQKVVTAFEVTEANVASLSYLSFDGIDDFMVTPTITPGTDKVQVFAGVRKLSDAANAAFLEYSAGWNVNDGTFVLFTSTDTSGVTGAFYRFGSRGNAAVSATTQALASGYAAPITNVVSASGDISGDLTTIRVNGTAGTSATGDQGTGNYLAYPMYIGRRGGTSLPFNGQMYGLITRFGSNLTTTAISRTESWMNGKTGAY